MTILTWIIRALLLLLILRFVLRLLFPQGRTPATAGRAERGRERLGGELVRDPNCGTYVPKTKALAVGSGAGTVYFCSTTCRDGFKKPHHEDVKI